MPNQKSILFGVLGFGLCVAFGLYITLAVTTPRGAPIVPRIISASTTKPRPVLSVLPVRLKIPKINVDAVVDRVDLVPGGWLAAPSGPSSVGWFAVGPRPGERGSSVMDGHSGWIHNMPAVFDNLLKLQRGDSLYVEGDKGTTITFVVREVRTYGQSEDGSAVFSSYDGKAHLNLITCEGVWSESQQSYSARLVVFADKSN